MKRVLICPSRRDGVQHLTKDVPAAAIPMLGQSLVEYWLSCSACAGVREILLLSDDRPEHVRAIAGNGERWGIKVSVLDESRELSPAQVLLKYDRQLELSAEEHVLTMDHFPGMPELPLFGSYKHWHDALLAWMPKAKMPDRVGVHELHPGVWTGTHCRISPKAELRGPCWLGKNVFVGDGVVVGPDAIVEDGAFLEAGAAVAKSVVGPDTFVGQFAEIAGSFAWGDTLIHLETGSAVKVPDPFLLCALRRPKAPKTDGFIARLSELCGRNRTEAHLLWKHFLLNKEG